MSEISPLYRKAARGEATPEELDFLDVVEGIKGNPSTSIETSIAQEDSPALKLLKQEWASKNERCIGCESHQE